MSRGRVVGGEQGLGDATQARPSREGVGDLAGLRPYQAGDPVRRIHWPTSARAGAPWIVLRAAESGGQVMVAVGPGEAGIRDACGEVVLHTRRGDAVGILAPGAYVPPSAGDGQDLRILAALARVEITLELPADPSGPAVTTVAVVRQGDAADESAALTLEARS